MRLMSLLVLIACTSKTPIDSSDTAPTDSGADEVLPDVPTYSGTSCPSIADGENADFESAEISRTFRVVMPANPQGAGVVFAWHWLGGSASQIINYMDLEAWADDYGFIVVAPESRETEAYEWDFNTRPANNADGIFFDDIVACLSAQYDIDMGAVHATGMSAGGLWTTWLTTYRASLLASTAPMSGGTTPGTYVSPDEPIPVLLTWGGTSDTYSGFSFDESSEDFSAGLQADGHFVVECEHDGGHTIPAEATDYIGRWFADHRRNQSSEPYETALPSGFPSFCRLP